MRSLSRLRIFVVLAVLVSCAQAGLVAPTVAHQRVFAPDPLAGVGKEKGAVDWSKAMVESTMKRYPTAQDLGAWGYAKSLYLYGQYLVWKRTGDLRYLQYIKD